MGTVSRMTEVVTPPGQVPPVERQVAGDMIRRAALVLPAVVLVSGLVWGWAGALSAAFAVGVVVVNFAVAGTLLSWAARISPTALMAATVFGFLARMGLVVAALWLVKGRSWANFAALAVVLLTTHLGLLFWETRYLSMSLAFPGLRPRHEQRD